MDWQPIDAMPKDGKTYLVGGRGFVGVGAWKFQRYEPDPMESIRSYDAGRPLVMSEAIYSLKFDILKFDPPWLEGETRDLTVTSYMQMPCAPFDFEQESCNVRAAAEEADYLAGGHEP